ncbi:ferredoxin [Saccharomonospora glauca]|uniref:Ferredoxin n=1 Tax=Saccharomonospora glauca K62 TaxID=928724 RepID=I1D7E0_9PSEU|nr:ferredoxin [Saccharomonospora glauca]EIF00865.1 ferredoxin [Saccharomonospora glauca K62]
MRIVADTDRCVGAGQCVLTESAVFDQNDDDGTVVVLVERPTGEQLENVRQAVELCPGRALSLVED